MGQFGSVAWDNLDLSHGTIWICCMGQFGSVAWDNLDLSHGTIWICSMRQFGSVAWDNLDLSHEPIWICSMRQFGSVTWDDLDLSHETIWICSMRQFGSVAWDNCQIIQELGLHKFRARWIPLALSEHHKPRRMVSSVSFLQQYPNRGHDFLETWSLETRHWFTITPWRQNVQAWSGNLLVPRDRKKFQDGKSAGKLCFGTTRLYW